MYVDQDFRGMQFQFHTAFFFLDPGSFIKPGPSTDKPIS